MLFLKYEDIIELAKENLGNKFKSEEEKYKYVKDEIDKSNIDKMSLPGGFDVFLSHSFKDKEFIYGLKIYLDNIGINAYVDWFNSPKLSRNDVDRKTADELKYIMQKSKSLIYVTTVNTRGSRWTPWEVGYFDGINGKIAILHILKNNGKPFKGEEYLRCYDLIEKNSSNNSFMVRGHDIRTWINE